jgi:alpha-mannosidase
VHILPHTHLDAGWKHSFEEYYQLEVKDILNSVVESLSNNPELKFNWSEIGFLHRWWIDQSE